MNFLEEIQKRRTFGIISHPDAGKTTLTEKLLLFGGAIQEAGAVKSNKIKKREQTIKLLEKSLQENYTKIRNLLIFLEKMKDKNTKENIDIIDKEIEKYK